MARATMSALVGDPSWILLKAPMPDESLDYWRSYLGRSKSSIFEVIDKAIHVAAVDFPKEFNGRRIQVAENLFNTGLPLCSACHDEQDKVHENSKGEKVEETEGSAALSKMQKKLGDSCNPNSHALREERRKEAPCHKLKLKPKYSEEMTHEMMLNIAKRKFGESYRQAHQAKKQRTIQIIELKHLPVQENKTKQTPNLANKQGIKRSGMARTPARARLRHLKF